MPTSLPLSCLTMPPRLDMLESHCNRKPLSEMNLNGYSEQDNLSNRITVSPRKMKPSIEIIETQHVNDIKTMLSTLRQQLAAVLKTKPSRDRQDDPRLPGNSSAGWSMKKAPAVSKFLYRISRFIQSFIHSTLYILQSLHFILYILFSVECIMNYLSEEYFYKFR